MSEAGILKAKWRRAVRAMFEGERYVYLKDTGGVIYVGNLETCQTYDVTREGCSCPDHREFAGPNGIRCKHLQAVYLHRDKIEKVPTAEERARQKRQEAAREFERIFG